MTVTNLLQELEVVEDVGDMLTGDYMTVLCWEGEALTDCALVTTAALYSPVQYSTVSSRQPPLTYRRPCPANRNKIFNRNLSFLPPVFTRALPLKQTYIFCA